MLRRLNASASGFEQEFADFVDTRREAEPDVEQRVAAIIADVQKRGDAALIELSRRFDGAGLTPATLRVSNDEIAAAAAACGSDVLKALDFAARRIESYHRRQIPANASFTDEAGVELGWRWTPVDSAGIYVPGGTASYPSSVLMNAIPARVAGVRRVAMVTPARAGKIASLTLAAAKIAGVSEVYRVGGAQAIAALAYGTASIAPVDKIVGPGNAYVAAAKRLVFGRVGIDSIAGPSEILVVADNANDPAWIAADLLSQAEHDPSSQAILITDDAAFADAVAHETERQLNILPRRDIAARAWDEHGAIILVPTIRDAAPLINRIAPEHLEIATANPDALLAEVRHAGAIFLGRHTPEAIGDYVAGSNHVLPTSRTARFSSGLSVFDFLKRSSLLCCNADALAALAPAALTLSEAEGLSAHRHSVAIRLNRSY
ncbi:MAG TPA: histidinol dehydrogenase [Micropepsaceae bacterium]|nr:histidinol dehydrogenase [Micropepsaceae bacterium]